MQCPKCSYELKRFTTMRSQKLVCPNCKTGLQLVGMYSPLLMLLLSFLPAQLINLFRSYQFRPGPFILTVLGCGYLAAWIAVIVYWIREARRPRLKERKRPEPEIVLNLNKPLSSQTPRQIG